MVQLIGVFLGPTASFSLTSPKWLIVFLAYLFLMVITAILIFPELPQKFTPSWMKKWKDTSLDHSSVRVIASALLGIVFFAALIFSPANKLALFYINGSFTNLTLLLLLVTVGSTLSGRSSKLQADLQHLSVSVILFGFGYGGALQSLFYRNQTIFFFVLAIITYQFFCLPWNTILKSTRMANLFSDGELTNIFLLILFAGALWVFLDTTFVGGRFLPSIMDEGSYGIKGLLFTSGKYTPYQDYGPWTNKMPFSFLLPGYVQAIFGNGILTLRVASFVMMLMMMCLLFVIGHHQWKPYGGILMAIFFALNPAVDNFYSLGNSQVYAATLLTLSAFFVFGLPQTTLTFALGNAVAAFTVLTRENLAPYFLLLNIYFLWKLGWRRSLPVIAVGVVVFVLGHWAFWPGILKVWAKWMPKSLTPFLNDFRYIGGGKVSWKLTPTKTDMIAVLSSFAQGITSNFYSLVGLVGISFAVSYKNFSRNKNLPEIVFLAVSLIVLNIAHGFITLDDGSCVYCFSGYLAFFLPLGIIFTMFMLRLAWESPSKAGMIWLVAVAGIFTVGDWFIHRKSLESMLYLKLPTLGSESGFQPLFVTLQQVTGIGPDDAKLVFPLAFGAIIFLFLAFLAYRVGKEINHISGNAHATIFVLLAFSLLAAPTANIWMHNRPSDNSCGGDVIAAHSIVDKELKAVISPGSQVYWLGESTTPFLTMDVKIFPQQINDGFSYKVGSNDEIAEKYGFWNENISARWVNQADYLMIEERYLGNPILESFDLTQFKQVTQTSPLDPCVPSSRYFIYNR